MNFESENYHRRFLSVNDQYIQLFKRQGKCDKLLSKAYELGLKTSIRNQFPTRTPPQVLFFF